MESRLSNLWLLPSTILTHIQILAQSVPNLIRPFLYSIQTFSLTLCLINISAIHLIYSNTAKNIIAIKVWETDWDPQNYLRVRLAHKLPESTMTNITRVFGYKIEADLPVPLTPSFSIALSL